LFAPVATISTETVTALNQLTVAPFAFDDIISTTANTPLTSLDAPSRPGEPRGRVLRLNPAAWPARNPASAR
jgi:hypothetical protein